jgi:hypothetical protein
MYLLVIFKYHQKIFISFVIIFNTEFGRLSRPSGSGVSSVYKWCICFCFACTLLKFKLLYLYKKWRNKVQHSSLPFLYWNTPWMWWQSFLNLNSYESMSM